VERKREIIGLCVSVFHASLHFSKMSSLFFEIVCALFSFSLLFSFVRTLIELNIIYIEESSYESYYAIGA